MKYHAHIYWKNDKQRNVAINMRTFLEDAGGELGRIWDKPIGPHPTSMYQVKYDDSNKDHIESYIKNNIGDLSVLLHNDTGNDLEDHTQDVIWLGDPIKLDLKAFK